jgi:hypothetical protein
MVVCVPKTNGQVDRERIEQRKRLFEEKALLREQRQEAEGQARKHWDSFEEEEDRKQLINKAQSLCQEAYVKRHINGMMAKGALQLDPSHPRDAHKHTDYVWENAQKPDLLDQSMFGAKGRKILAQAKVIGQLAKSIPKDLPEAAGLKRAVEQVLLARLYTVHSLYLQSVVVLYVLDAQYY